MHMYTDCIVLWKNMVLTVDTDIFCQNLLLCSIEALWTVRVSCLLLFFSSLRDTQMKKKREKHWYWKRAACVRWPKEGMQWLSCYLAICLWRSDKKSTGSHCALKNGACRSASSMSAKRRLSMSSILACWSNLMQSRATIPQLAKCTGMFEAKLVKMLEHWNQKKTHLSWECLRIGSKEVFRSWH